MITARNKSKRLLVSQIRSHCADCGARTCSILRNCPAEVLDKISAAKKCFVYLKGQRILMQGVESNGIFFINTGKVKIYKTDKNNKQLIIRFAKSGEVLGFCSVDDRKEQSASAMALDDTLICHLDYKLFLQIIREYPEMALSMLRYYNDMLSDAENKSLKLARMNVPSKIADALITMYQAYGTNGNNRTLNLAISRQDIADLAGTTKEQVSKTLTDFKTHGIIHAKGKQIDVLDIDKLRQMAEI
jgi:CRP/FNR family transcriptional regulator, polysaccharide utilization system transcription regulator